MNEWYLEYEITVNRPGLLGDISSLLGLLRVNIVTINGVFEDNRRVMLLRTEDDRQIERFALIARTMESIELIKIRKPRLHDRLTVRHGRFIDRSEEDSKIFRFVRKDLGVLVDYMAELFKEEGHRLIGVRGMPRVGKTEAVVAASVSANKKWVFLSSTMIKQTVRHRLQADEYGAQHIFILDGIVTRKAGDERHLQLVREIMSLPAVKVIEHPDLFVQHSEYTLDDFDTIIELRTDETEEITYERLEKQERLDTRQALDAFRF
ncbi:MAG TPA: DUF3388 domain-containing protein [Savagea sp.]